MVAGAAARPCTEMSLALLHGFLGDRNDWSFVAGHLRYPSMAIDLPGHGDNQDHPPEFSHLLTWLAASLPDRVHLAGYSMGGRIAMHYARAYPARVRSLTVISASPGIEDETARVARRAQDARWAATLRSVPLPEFLEAWYRQPVFASLQEKTDLLISIKQHRSGGRPELLAGALEQWGQGIVPALWPWPLTVPVQWIFGEHDAAYVAVAGHIRRRLPGAVHIVSDAGHTVHLEQPATVADSIRNFIEGCEV